MSLNDIFHNLKSIFSTFQIELYDNMIYFQYINSEDIINF